MPKISHQNVWVGNLFTGNLQRWKDYWNKELTIRANKWTLNYKEEGKGSAKGFSFAKSSVESLPGKKVALGLFDKSLMNPICLSRYSYKRDRAWPICFKNNLPYLFLSTHLTSGIVLIIEAAEEPTWVLPRSSAYFIEGSQIFLHLLREGPSVSLSPLKQPKRFERIQVTRHLLLLFPSIEIFDSCSYL